jgi:hypothetical protein
VDEITYALIDDFSSTGKTCGSRKRCNGVGRNSSLFLLQLAITQKLVFDAWCI